MVGLKQEIGLMQELQIIHHQVLQTPVQVVVLVHLADLEL
jgi:hypothetical protein